MSIASLRAYRVELRLHATSCHRSGGRSVTVFGRTVGWVDTNTSLAGHDEVCLLGPRFPGTA